MLTLFAFFMVAIAVLVLRKTDPNRARPFKTPLVWVVAPVAAGGCLFLFFSLPTVAQLVLPIWGSVGLVIYFLYSRKHSHVGKALAAQKAGNK